MIFLESRWPYLIHQTFSKSKLTLLLVYIDNIILSRDNEPEKQISKEKFNTQFKMEDLQK